MPDEQSTATLTMAEESGVEGRAVFPIEDRPTLEDLLKQGVEGLHDPFGSTNALLNREVGKSKAP